MGGRGSASSAAQSAQAQRAPAAPPPQQQQAQQPTAQADSLGFAATDRADFHQLYNGSQYYAQQNLTIDQQLAVMQYLSASTENGSLYSMSQNMNWALSHGQRLTANQQYVYNEMMGAMHNLGYNLTLQRYTHGDFMDNLLKEAGVRGTIDTVSEGALKKALVGRAYTEKGLTSVSYNDFANAPASSRSTFDTRQVRIEYRAKAGTQAMMPGNGAGGSLGEMVLAPGQQTRIVDVYKNGKKARAKRTRSMSKDQYTIVVEIG